jgi:hypothetical protein
MILWLHQPPEEAPIRPELQAIRLRTYENFRLALKERADGGMLQTVAEHPFHHQRCPLPGSIEQPLDRGLVVADRSVKHDPTSPVHDRRVMLGLADIQASPGVDLLHTILAFTRHRCTRGLEGLLRRIHLTNEPLTGRSL